MLVDKIMIDVPHRGTLGVAVAVDFYYVTAVLQKGKCSVICLLCRQLSVYVIKV